MRARLATAAVLIACTGVLVVEDACVLAEPPGELPRLPESRPTIVHTLLVPTSSAVLTRFPSVFIVPVELADPTVEFSYAAFIDYDPLSREGLVLGPESSTFVAANAAGGRMRVLNIPIALPESLDPNRCHVIEVVVALRFVDFRENAHTPQAPGGDTAYWFYNPNGDFGGCPSLDAGIDAPSDADAAEVGTQ